MQQNRAVLDHQQFDFVVRMMNCCLQVWPPPCVHQDLFCVWGMLRGRSGPWVSCPEAPSPWATGAEECLLGCEGCGVRVPTAASDAGLHVPG